MSRYWKTLWDALSNRLREPVVVQRSADLPETGASSAGLEMDLAERDRRIEAMRKEYELLERDRDRAAVAAGAEQVERLCAKLAAKLSSGAVLAAAAESGQSVESSDWAALFRGVEKELGRAGLERVGSPGDKAAFDVAVHQRMSGGSVAQGDPVVVRVPGYRMREKVLLKAMVSQGGAAHV